MNQQDPFCNPKTCKFIPRCKEILRLNKNDPASNMNVITALACDRYNLCPCESSCQRCPCAHVMYKHAQKFAKFVRKRDNINYEARFALEKQVELLKDRLKIAERNSTPTSSPSCSPTAWSKPGLIKPLDAPTVASTTTTTTTVSSEDKSVTMHSTKHLTKPEKTKSTPKSTPKPEKSALKSTPKSEKSVHTQVSKREKEQVMLINEMHVACQCNVLAEMEGTYYKCVNEVSYHSNGLMCDLHRTRDDLLIASYGSKEMIMAAKRAESYPNLVKADTCVVNPSSKTIMSVINVPVPAPVAAPVHKCTDTNKATRTTSWADDMDLEDEVTVVAEHAVITATVAEPAITEAGAAPAKPQRKPKSRGAKRNKGSKKETKDN